MTNEMNTARPVGDDALRGALIEVQQLLLNLQPHIPQAAGRRAGSIDSYVNPALEVIRSALASHPTTGQETVATPRDGGVREALDAVFTRSSDVLRDAEEFDLADKLDEAIVSLAALSAPGSAGPGERETREWTIRRDALEEAARLVEAWVSQHENNQSLARQIGTNMAAGIRDLLALATPSPAQEPGTGDTGERARTIRAFKAGAVWASENPIHADMPLQRQLMAERYVAAPATTAETRGPAEGAR